MKNIDHNNYKEHIDKLLAKIRGIDISPLVERVVDVEAGSFKKYNPNTEEYLDFYALTPQERKKAIATVEKFLTNIMTPAMHVDNLLQYAFFNRFKSFHD